MMLAAWCLFAMVDTSVKWLVLLGLPALQLAFMRYATQFAVTLAISGTGGSGSLWPGKDIAGMLLIRAALLLSATVFNFIALRYLELTVTAAIMFSSPIIVSALSGPLLGERVGLWRWAAICIGFLGVLTVIRPFGESFHWSSLLIVYNAFALALFSILTRKLSDRISPQTMQFYLGGLGTAALLPAAVWVWSAPTTTTGWVVMGLVGLWAWGGHELFARAHRLAQAATLMPFAYSFIIFMALGSYLLFNDLPDAFTVLGAALIVLSGLLIWWRKQRRLAIA